MTKVQAASTEVPRVTETLDLFSSPWRRVFDELSTLHRRCAYAGLTPEGLDLIQFGQQASHLSQQASHQYVVVALRQIDEIGANMTRHGMPAGHCFRLLTLTPEWQRVLTTPSAPPQEALTWIGDVADHVADAVHEMNDQIEMSPQPAGEWAPAIDTLGEDLLASLVGTSVSSVRRYSTRARETPQEVAERLHFVALVLADLAGSYNDFGIRRWFSRPRSALGDQSPADLLGKFDIDGEDAQKVADLAAALTGAGAA